MASPDDGDANHLTESQQQALETLTSVTNQELADAISLLKRSEWNVQVYSTSREYSKAQALILSFPPDSHCQILRW